MWMFAIFFIILLAVASGLIAAAVMLHQAVPRSSAESPSPPVAYETTMVGAPEIRKVFPFSLVPGGARNLDEAPLLMGEFCARSQLRVGSEWRGLTSAFSKKIEK